MAHRQCIRLSRHNMFFLVMIASILTILRIIEFKQPDNYHIMNVISSNDDNTALLKTKQSLVITGMIKDGEPNILGTLVQIEKFACHFEEIDIVILENNSKDKTREQLNVWSSRPIHCDYIQIHLANQNKTYNSRKHIIHFDASNDPALLIHDKEDKFVFYRNIIIHYVTHELLDEKRNILHNDTFVYDYWMMVDFDIQGIDQSRIFNEFLVASHGHLNVDVFCVNGITWTGRYRDTFATVFDNYKWCYNYDNDFNCSQIIQNKRFTKVKSCFGGLTIYKFKIIQKTKCKYHTLKHLKDKAINAYLWYEKQDTEIKKRDSLCEHISFHFCLHNNYEKYYKKNLVMVISR
eukprot:86385_1